MYVYLYALNYTVVYGAFHWQPVYNRALYKYYVDFNVNCLLIYSTRL